MALFRATLRIALSGALVAGCARRPVDFPDQPSHTAPAPRVVDLSLWPDRDTLRPVLPGQAPLAGALHETSAPLVAFDGAALEVERRTIERVVAYVDREPILLSDLRARARPYLKTLPLSDAARPARVHEIHRETLERMIDERLLGRAAAAKHVSVSDADVEAALRSVAEAQKLSVDRLLFAAWHAGWEEERYRAELRTQLLEHRLVVLELARTEGPTSGPAYAEAWIAARRTLMEELRQAAWIERRLSP